MQGRLTYKKTHKQKSNMAIERQLKTTWQSLPALIVLFIWTFMVIVPLWVLVSAAIKSGPELLTNQLGLPQAIAWNNFSDAWTIADLGTAFMNSSIIAIAVLIGLVVFGSMAAYPLARHTSVWSHRLYTYFIAGIIIPANLSLIALYRELQSLSLLDTHQGMILLDIATGLPLVIFLYTGFIKSVPRELEEAAVLDGAGSFRRFWLIVFPLLQPVTATVIITSSLSIWNDFLGPLLFLQGDDKRTIPVAIFSFVGQYNNDWTHIFAAVLLSIIPVLIVFFVLQRNFIKGLSGGALRG